MLPDRRQRRLVTDSLGGARIALLEARRESELASLVRRHGGEPVCVPAMREIERDCAVQAERAIESVARGGAVVVLATGVGLQRWLNVAASVGRGQELHDGLSRSLIVCRGPKPLGVLKREGLPVHVRAVAPHTTKELLDALGGVDVRDRDVVFVHDGGASRVVPEALAARGGRVLEVQPYAWALPADVGPLGDLVGSIVAGDVRAVAFTTQAQARNLFEVAESRGLRAALAKALRGAVIVAAVGPTCARVLEELGAPPHVIPDHAKMGSLVQALASYLGSRPD
jgi:uroporphyrinogen-III synthase